MSKSDSNIVLRRLPIFAGGLAGTLLFINRLLTIQLTDSQARSDALGIIEGAVLILVGLIWQQIQPRIPESVTLIGESGFDLNSDLPERVQLELAWASHILLNNTVTRSIVVYYEGKTIMRRGVFGKSSQVKKSTIIERVFKTKKAVYLVNLNLYPGKIEFDYLPENTQGVICQPIGDKGVLILGANAPRSYTKKDEKWIEAIADKLAETIKN